MIFLDFLFKICYAPLQSQEGKGKLVATYWLSMPLAFFLMGLTNILKHLLSPILYFRISPIGMSILGFGFATISIVVLQRIYIRNKRDVGKTRFAILYGLLIPVLVFGSIIFFAVSFKFK